MTLLLRRLPPLSACSPLVGRRGPVVEGERKQSLVGDEEADGGGQPEGGTHLLTIGASGARGANGTSQALGRKQAKVRVTEELTRDLEPSRESGDPGLRSHSPPELPLTPWPQSCQESPQICTAETGPGAALTHCPSVPRVQGWRPPGSPRHLRPAFTYSSSVLSRSSLRAFLTNVSLWDGEGPPQQGSPAQPPPRRGSQQSSAPAPPSRICSGFRVSERSGREGSGGRVSLQGKQSMPEGSPGSSRGLTRDLPIHGPWGDGVWAGNHDFGGAQPGTHPVSFGPGDASRTPLTGHPLQTWRALSPRGASRARCALREEGAGGLWWAAPAQDPSTQAPFPSLPPLPSQPLPFLLLPQQVARTTRQPHLLWDRLCQECRGGHGAPGGPGRRESHVHLGSLVHPVADTRSHEARDLGQGRREEQGAGQQSAAGVPWQRLAGRGQQK